MHSAMKMPKLVTTDYLRRLVFLQAQIERAKGSGLTLKQCLAIVLKELQMKGAI